MPVRGNNNNNAQKVIVNIETVKQLPWLNPTW